MKHLTPVLCALITAGFGYLTATTAVKRDAEATRYEQTLATVTAERNALAEEVADLKADLNVATVRRPKRAARGEAVQPPATEPVTRTAEIQGALARATVAAKSNPATAILPKRALAARIARGLR